MPPTTTTKNLFDHHGELLATLFETLKDDGEWEDYLETIREGKRTDGEGGIDTTNCRVVGPNVTVTRRAETIRSTLKRLFAVKVQEETAKEQQQEGSSTLLSLPPPPPHLLGGGDPYTALHMAIAAILKEAKDGGAAFGNQHAGGDHSSGAEGDESESPLDRVTVLSHLVAAMLMWTQGERGGGKGDGEEKGSIPAPLLTMGTLDVGCAAAGYDNQPSSSLPSLGDWLCAMMDEDAPSSQCEDDGSGGTVSLSSPTARVPRLSRLASLPAAIALASVREASLGLLSECYQILDESEDTAKKKGSDSHDTDDGEEKHPSNLPSSALSSSELRAYQTVLRAAGLACLSRHLLWAGAANEARRQAASLLREEEEEGESVGGAAASSSSSPLSSRRLPKILPVLLKSIAPDIVACVGQVILPRLAVVTSQVPSNAPSAAAASAANGIGWGKDEDLLCGNDIQPTVATIGSESAPTNHGQGVGGGTAPSSTSSSSPLLGTVLTQYILPLLKDLVWLYTSGDDEKTNSSSSSPSPHRITLVNTLLDCMGYVQFTLKYGSYNGNTNGERGVLAGEGLCEGNNNEGATKGAEEKEEAEEDIFVKPTSVVQRAPPPPPLLAPLLAERDEKYSKAMAIYKKRMAQIEERIKTMTTTAAASPPSEEERQHMIQRFVGAKPEKEALGCYTSSEKGEGGEKSLALRSISVVSSSSLAVKSSLWSSFMLSRLAALIGRTIPRALVQKYHHHHDHDDTNRGDDGRTLTAASPSCASSPSSRCASMNATMMDALVRECLHLRSAHYYRDRCEEKKDRRTLKQGATPHSSPNRGVGAANVNVSEWWAANASSSSSSSSQRLADLIDPAFARDMPIEHKMERIHARNKALDALMIMSDDDEDFEEGGGVDGGIASNAYVWLSPEEKARRRAAQQFTARVVGKIPPIGAPKAAWGSGNDGKKRLQSSTREMIDRLLKRKPLPTIRAPPVTIAYLLLQTVLKNNSQHPTNANPSSSSLSKHAAVTVEEALAMLHGFAPIAVDSLRLVPPSSAKEEEGEEDANAASSSTSPATKFMATLSTAAVTLMALERLLLQYHASGDSNSYTTNTSNNKYTIDFPEEFLHDQERRMEALRRGEGGDEENTNGNDGSSNNSASVAAFSQHTVRSSNTYHAYASLTQCLMALITTCPSAEHRAMGRRVFTLLLDSFVLGIRRKLLSALFALSPNSRTAEAVLGYMKREAAVDQNNFAAGPQPNSTATTSATVVADPFVTHSLLLEMTAAMQGWVLRDVKLMRLYDWVPTITAAVQWIRLLLTYETRRWWSAVGGSTFAATDARSLRPLMGCCALLTVHDAQLARRMMISDRKAENVDDGEGKGNNNTSSSSSPPPPPKLYVRLSTMEAIKNQKPGGGGGKEDAKPSPATPPPRPPPQHSAENVIATLLSTVITPLNEVLRKELGGNNNNESSTSPSSLAVIVSTTSSSSSSSALTPATLFGLECAVEGIQSLIEMC